MTAEGDLARWGPVEAGDERGGTAALAAAAEAVLRRRAGRADVWAEVGPDVRSRLAWLIDVLANRLGAARARAAEDWSSVVEEGAFWASGGMTRRAMSELVHAASLVLQRRVVDGGDDARAQEVPVNERALEAFAELVQDLRAGLEEGHRRFAGADGDQKVDPHTLLLRLFEEPLDDPTLMARRLREAGMDVTPPVALVVLTDGPDDAPVEPVDTRAVRAARRLPGAILGPLPPSRRPEGFDFVVLGLPAAREEAVKDALRELEAGCVSEQLVGVYAVAKSLGDVYPIAVRLRDAATVAAPAAGSVGRVVPIGTLLPYRLAVGLDPLEQIAQVESTLGPLLAGKVDRALAHLETLRALQQARRCKLVEAAKLAHVHVNTLRSRIGAIEQLTGLDVEDHAARFDLALRLLDLWGEDRPRSGSAWWGADGEA